MTALLIIVSALFLVQIFTNIFLLRTIHSWLKDCRVKSVNLNNIYEDMKK